ncbi:MAG: threonine transporter [Gammaproteobacteria bacterium]|nr:MAG: threonine transporter [Gammaproteobacteria bacterium]
MFEIQCYQSFIITILLFQLLPGAGTVVILSAAASHGIKSGMSAVCGTLAGDFLYMLSAVLGLATLLQSFPYIFKIAQYTGALYLCFSGLQKILLDHRYDSVNHKQNMSHFKTFKHAFKICLANPKAIIFFLALFPLFLSKESKPITLVSMMFHVTIISLIYQSFLVVIGNTVRQLLCRWRYSRLVATRLAGAALIAFGIKLAKNIE